MTKIKSFLIFMLPFMIVLTVKSQEVTQVLKTKSYSSFKKTEYPDTLLIKAQGVISPESNLYRNTSKYLPIIFTVYGFSALVINPIKQVNYKFQEKILAHHPTFSTHIDDYLQYYPVITTFAFKLGGKSGNSNFKNSVSVYAISSIMMAGTVYTLKKAIGELRPDGSNKESFPSGHTATAFAGAEFMHQEFKDSAPIWSYTGFVAATATGGLRMFNNKHYFSDVLAGAGIGILSTKAAYWLNEKLFAKKIKKAN